MKNTNKSLRLTERDVEYISWIAEQQAVRLDTLLLLFQVRGKDIDLRALRRLVERWQKLGLIQKQEMAGTAGRDSWRGPLPGQPGRDSGWTQAAKGPSHRLSFRSSAGIRVGHDAGNRCSSWCRKLGHSACIAPRTRGCFCTPLGPLTGSSRAPSRTS